MEVVASLSQDCTAAAQCGLFTHKSVLVIFEPSCIMPVVGRWVSPYFYRSIVHYLSNHSRHCVNTKFVTVLQTFY